MTHPADNPRPGVEINSTLLGNTRLSAVAGEAGRLAYAGYDLHDLITGGATWDEVAYLLRHDDLPTNAQLDEWQRMLAAYRSLTADQLAVLRQLPPHAHGMDALRSAVSLFGAYAAPPLMHVDTVWDEGLRLTALVPTITATLIRLRQGLPPVAPDPTLDHAANLLYMLHGTPPDPVAHRALNTYMVIMAENGLNVATFVACVLTSTRNDVYSAVVAALATLKGVLHGGANEYAMRTFLAIGEPTNARPYLEAMLARKERLFGVGHRVFKGEDPRYRHMRDLSAALAARPGSDNHMHAVAVAVEEQLGIVPYFASRGLQPNVEFYSAPLLHQLGFPPDYFTVAFACARMPGWVAHMHEQLQNGRLVRPEAAYIGHAPRPFVPRDLRS